MAASGRSTFHDSHRWAVATPLLVAVAVALLACGALRVANIGPIGGVDDNTHMGEEVGDAADGVMVSVRPLVGGRSDAAETMALSAIVGSAVAVALSVGFRYRWIGCSRGRGRVRGWLGTRAERAPPLVAY